MKGESQSEFFQEYKEEKGKFAKIADRITKRQERLSVHLPLENAVVWVIIFLMCVIVAFALGTERGKRLAVLEGVEGETIPAVPLRAEVKEIARSEKEHIPVKERDARPAETVTEVLPSESERGGLYAVQLVSFKKAGKAYEEKNKLLNKKVGAFIIHSGNWYQVCAGGYSSFDEAKKALGNLKEDYEGAFIRNR